MQQLLEQLQGRALYALTYLASGLAGGFASILWNGDQVWSAGASGAVFGVYGGILGYMLRERQALPKSIFQSMMKSRPSPPTTSSTASRIPRIDNAAHAGGALCGLAFGWMLALPMDRERRRQLLPRRLGLALGALAVLTIAGVSSTPRFDYSAREELSWHSTNDEFDERESTLIAQHDKALSSLRPGAGLETRAEWISSTLIPFYRGWRQKLDALNLTSGWRTDARRDELVRVFDLRLEAYQHLVDDLRAGTAGALSRYRKEEARVNAEIEKLQALP